MLGRTYDGNVSQSEVSQTVILSGAESPCRNVVIARSASAELVEVAYQKVVIELFEMPAFRQPINRSQSLRRPFDRLRERLRNRRLREGHRPSG